MPIVPPGHKVVVVKSDPRPFFASTASGPMVLNFGAVQFIPAGLSTLQAFLASVTERRSVLWLMPASILPVFIEASELFNEIARLVASAPLVSHLAVFPDDFPSLERIMTSFRDIGVGAQRGAPDGSCYVEVHTPDGTIVVGIPGPELAPEPVP